MQVTEMQAEYFAPKEDIILQNDNPSDLYLLVSGAVVCRILWIYHVYDHAKKNLPGLEY